MKNKDISQMVLDRIKDTGIKPISKKIFNLKRVVVFSFIGFSIIVGAISFSVILSILTNNEWDLYNRFGVGFIFKTLPYFWFVCVLLLAILGDIYYRKTSRGHRPNTIIIVSAYIIATTVLGSMLHLIGLGDVVEESISQNIPVYHIFVFDKDEFWSNSKEGLISGRIILIKEKMLSIVDFNNNLWTINTENADILGNAKIQEGEIIKIIGDAGENNTFTAEEIRPWGQSKIHKNNFSEVVR